MKKKYYIITEDEGVQNDGESFPSIKEAKKWMKDDAECYFSADSGDGEYLAWGEEQMIVEVIEVCKVVPTVRHTFKVTTIEDK